MAEDKISAIRDWTVPGSVRGIQSFLGFVNFYRKFVRSLASLAAPLTELTRKDVPWCWSDACQSSFLALKKAIVDAPDLSHPCFDQQFILETDASDFAIGAVLSQPVGSGSEELRPVGFFSCKMIPAERNYDVHDKELLAIVRALDHWSHYLLGSAFVVRIFTDHRNLIYFRDRRSLNARQLRWKMFLAQFQFNLAYRRGVDNVAADLLSRRIDFMEGEGESLTASRSFAEYVLLLEDLFVNEGTVMSISLVEIEPVVGKPTFVAEEKDRIEIILAKHNSLLAGNPGRSKTFTLVSEMAIGGPGKIVEIDKIKYSRQQTFESSAKKSQVKSLISF